MLAIHDKIIDFHIFLIKWNVGHVK
jgi:hypothetical protein